MRKVTDSNKYSVKDSLVDLAKNSDLRKRLDNQYVIVLTILIVLFVSTFFIQIDQTVNLTGQIVPNSGIARINNETGGIINDIRVKNYQLVEKGDLLVAFDKSKYKTSLKNNYSKLRVIDSEIINSVAFLKDNFHNIKEQNLISEVEKFINNIPDAVAHSIELAQTSKKIADHKDKLIQEQIDKNKIEVTKLKAEQKLLSTEIEKLNEQREIFNTLLKSKNVSKIQAIDYEIKFISAKREFAKISSNIDEKNKETNELENKRIVQHQDEIKNKYEELLELNKQKLDLVSNISQLEETIKNLDIKAPISGIIQGLDFVAGVTVQPGEVILSIIPKGAEVVFEAKASTANKAKIDYNSRVEVQFDGFNAIQFNRVPGEIINISPFTFNDNPLAESFTKIIVKLDNNYIESPTQKYPIQLGISGTLFVYTEKQSLFSYVFGPIYNSFTNTYGQKS